MGVDTQKEIREHNDVRLCKCGAVLESGQTRCNECIVHDHEWEAQQPR